MAWTLADLRSKFRSLTGRSSVGEISDNDVDTLINDYMQYDFPLQVQLDQLDGSWSQTLAATDDGEYSVDNAIIEITKPLMLNGVDELIVFYEQEEFWRAYPANEDTTTDPSLAVGTSNAARVKYSDFTYDVSGYQYSKAASEEPLSGDNVPIGTYGAWMLEVDADGVLTVTAASSNASGYDTPALAVAGIPTADSDRAVLGFVTATCSSGAFVPGTTELNTAANVTATFTDGHPDLRARPEAILLTLNAGKAYVRPKPDDAYIIASRAVLQRPTALSGDSSTPLDPAWGLALALGAAIKFLASKEGEGERITELMTGNAGLGIMPGSLKYELAQIRRKQFLQQKPEIERYW